MGVELLEAHGEVFLDFDGLDDLKRWLVSSQESESSRGCRKDSYRWGVEQYRDELGCEPKEQ